MLQQRSSIVIATYGSKFDTKSGGAWVLSTHHGNLLSHGTNLDYYDSMDNIHSHWLEAYAILSNKFTTYCDKKKIVNKISKIKILNNYYDINYQMLEHDIIMAIKSYLPHNTKYFIFTVIKKYK